MGCVGSDAEDEPRVTRAKTSLSTRYKFSKKCSDDGVAVVYASVPRKLRSANKKRCREFISRHVPSNKKLNHATNEIEFSRKVGLEQSISKKRDVSDGYGEQLVIGPTTKDEEEVAEALYALAAVFPETVKMDKAKGEGELREAESAAFLGMENSGPNVEDTAAMKEELGTKKIGNDSAKAANHSSNVAESAREVVISSAEHGIETLRRNTVVSCKLPGANSRPGSKTPQPDLSLTSGKVEVLGSAAGIRGQSELLCCVKEKKINGISSIEARDSDMWGPSSQLSTSRLPATFVDSSCSSQPSALEKPITTKKVDPKKSRKRSCTHVYISHLIKNLEISERVKTSPVHCIQSMADEGLKQGAHITCKTSNKSTSGLNGIVTTDSAICSAAERNSAEVRNAILLHKRLLQDQQQASTTSRLYLLQKPSVDFLSLRAGGAGGEIRNGTAKANHSLGTPTQLDVPHLQSKKHPALPFLLPQDCYSSNPFLSHPGAATAEQVQFPPILGSTNSGPLTTGVIPSPKQLPWMQQQQIWTDQLTAHSNPGRVAAPSIIPNWQNGGQDAPSLLQYAPSIFLPPRSSAEALGSTNALTSWHQQPLVALSSPLPTPQGLGQHHRVPHGYEGKGDGRPSESVPPLQLLCNEHL